VESSLVFAYYNSSKRGVTLNVSRAEAGPLLDYAIVFKLVVARRFGDAAGLRPAKAGPETQRRHA
jgi:hypothetical protein